MYSFQLFVSNPYKFAYRRDFRTKVEGLDYSDINQVILDSLILIVRYQTQYGHGQPLVSFFFENLLKGNKEWLTERLTTHAIQGKGVMVTIYNFESVRQFYSIFYKTTLKQKILHKK